MKILAIFALALLALLGIAYVLGWRNLGNAPPVVTNKIALLRGETTPPLLRKSVDAATVGDIGQRPCRDFLAAVQEQQPLDVYLSWLDGFLAARAADDGVLPSHLTGPENLRVAFAAVCTEHPDKTLIQAARMLAERHASEPLR